MTENVEKSENVGKLTSKFRDFYKTCVLISIFNAFLVILKVIRLFPKFSHGRKIPENVEVACGIPCLLLLFTDVITYMCIE